MAYFDITGKSMTFAEWAPRLVDDEYRMIARTEIRAQTPDRVDTLLLVNTKWIGINRGICSGPLKIFETGIFDQDEQRLGVNYYSTREEARTGHAKVVWCVYSGLEPFAPLPLNATCITCRVRQIGDRFRLGSWLCFECAVEVDGGNLLHPVPRIASALA